MHSEEVEAASLGMGHGEFGVGAGGRIASEDKGGHGGEEEEASPRTLGVHPKVLDG